MILLYSPAVWYRVALTPVSGQTSSVLAAGYDTTLSYNATTGDLAIIVSGGYG